MSKPIPISEIFGPTIQGEGALIGRPTIFVRTGGCDYRCSWCDTLYAVLPEHRHDWAPQSAEVIIDKVLLLSGGAPILVTLSGGNPAIHDLSELLRLGKERDLTFAMETQGSVAREWFSELDYLVLSPKPPSSEMNTDWEKLSACVEAAGTAAKVLLKIVVFNDRDYHYAREVHLRFPHSPFYLQTGTENPMEPQQMRERVEWLLERCTRDAWFDVTILPQLHVMLWGNKRGV